MATNSISTGRVRGRAATWTVDRAGGSAANSRGVDRIDNLEVGHIGQEDRRLDHIRETGAGRGQHCGQVRQHLPGLGLDALDQLAARRVQTDLAGREDEVAGRIAWLYGPMAAGPQSC